MFYAAEKQVFLRQIFESDYKQCIFKNTFFYKTNFKN